MIQTVVELDLKGYSDVVRELEDHLSASVVLCLNDQIQGFVDAGLKEVGIAREDAVMATTGDGAILAFHQAQTGHAFAVAVHSHCQTHSQQKTVASAQRWFRIGIATGDLSTRGVGERKEIAGAVIARAKRLESAAEVGEIVVDVATFAALPPDVQGLYGAQETIKGKRAEKFTVHRFVVTRPEAHVPDLSARPPGKWRPWPWTWNLKLVGHRPGRTVLAIGLSGLLIVAAAYLLPTGHRSVDFPILVADMDGPPRYAVTESLIEDLRKAMVKYPHVRIEPLRSRISAQEGTEKARAVGKKHRASVVVWGWYRTSGNKTLVTLHCELLATGLGPPELRGDAGGIYNLTRLESFELQKELGSDMTSLALFFVGLTRLKAGDYEGAIQVLSEAVAHLRGNVGPDEAASIYSARGSCYGQLRSVKNARNAISDFTEAIARKPDLVDAYCNRASAYLGLERSAEALADCDKVLEVSPGHAVALANRSAVLCKLGRFDEALVDAQAAKKAVPWFSGYGLMVAQALSGKGQTEKALAECAEVLKREPGSILALLVRASINRQAGRLDEAIRQYTELLRLPKSEADAYFGRAGTYEDKGEYQKAAADYDALLRLFPDSAYVHVLRGQMRELTGKHALAITDLEYAIAWKSNIVQTPLENVYSLLGAAYSKLGNWPAAVTNYSSAIELNPACWDARRGRGSALLFQGSLTNALEDFSKAIERNTNSPELFYYRGVVYAGMQLHSNAVLDLTRSIGLNTNNLAAYLYRGVAFWGLGALSDAVRDCEMAQHVTNDPPTLANVEKLWAGILQIALDPAHPENRRSVALQPDSEHQRVQKLLVGARGGSLVDYQQLGLLADEKAPVGPMAKTAIADVNLYFEIYRSRMYLTRSFINPVSLKPMPVPIDEVVFHELRSPHWTQRETAVFYLAAARKDSTIPHICDTLLAETNLYLISDITRALNEITGSRHGALDIQSVSNWWTANVDNSHYQSPFTASQAYWNYLVVPVDQAEKAIGFLSQTIAAEPTAYWTRCFRAGCYTTLRKFDLANQDLEAVGKASPRLCWYLFYRTLLQCAQGRLEEGVDSLNELLVLDPLFEANTRLTLPPEVLTNSRIHWPKQNTNSGAITN